MRTGVILAIRFLSGFHGAPDSYPIHQFVAEMQTGVEVSWYFSVTNSSYLKFVPRMLIFLTSAARRYACSGESQQRAEVVVSATKH